MPRHAGDRRPPQPPRAAPSLAPSHVPSLSRSSSLNASRFHFCRGCDRESQQRYLYSENGTNRTVEHWRCARCGLEFLSYADLLDAEGMCLHVLSRYLRSSSTQEYGDVRSLDREEALAELRALLHELYVRKWRPADTPRFRSYATFKLPRAFIDHLRHEGERNGVPKAHTHALSLDGPAGMFHEDDDSGFASRVPGRSLGESLDTSSSDREAGSLADFRRALARRGRDVAREERALGL